MIESEREIYLSLSESEELNLMVSFSRIVFGIANADNLSASQRGQLQMIHTGICYRMLILSGQLKAHVFWSRSFFVDTLLMNSNSDPGLTSKICNEFALSCYIAANGPENVPEDSRWPDYSASPDAKNGT